MRVKKTTPAARVLYAWDSGRIFAEYDEAGNVIQETVYFGSTPVALLKNGAVYRVFADQIDTPRVLTNETNTVLWAWNSKPFGESHPNDDVDGDGTSLSYNLRFPGQYYNFNRDYNPAAGRYVQSDPIGLEGGLNSFNYVQSQPLTKTDALGLYPKSYNSFNYLYHEYKFSHNVCFTFSSKCTVANVWNALKKFPAPTVYSIGGWLAGAQTTALTNGQRSFVVGAGNVVHHVYDSEVTLYNITEPDHIFHDGYVRRRVVKTFTGINVETYGEGINQGYTSLLLNTQSALPGFTLVDINLALAL